MNDGFRFIKGFVVYSSLLAVAVAQAYVAVHFIFKFW